MNIFFSQKFIKFVDSWTNKSWLHEYVYNDLVNVIHGIMNIVTKIMNQVHEIKFIMLW